MQTKMRPRYYCDHCGKGSGSPSAMIRHERGCTLNPNRKCGMCARIADTEEVCSLSRDQLVKVFDADGFPALVKAARACPACILSAIRQRLYVDDYGDTRVSGPNDGRNEWRFEDAKREFWKKVNELEAGGRNVAY